MRAPEFWSRGDAASRLLARVLSPIGAVYGGSVALRARFAKPYRARAKVVCVGNLTAGGTGKTPVAIAVANALLSQGKKVCFLTRGYGGRIRGPVFVDAAHHDASDVGDEPLLLVRTAPVVVAADRRAGAALADAHAFDAIVMDDGHQNFQLEKDLSIVVLDTDNPFGNGFMIPAGPLREPVAQGLARADAVVAFGCEAFAGDMAYRGLVLRAALKAVNAEALKGARVVAFAGIGRPTKFLDTLKACGAQIVDSRTYGDHHAYSAREIADLKARSREESARLVTTEKDYVRMTPAEREGVETLTISVAFDDPSLLQQLVARLGAKTGA